MELFLLEVTVGPHECFADRQIFNALAEYFSVAMSKLFLCGDAVISGTRQALTTRIHPQDDSQADLEAGASVWCYQ